MSEQPAPVHNVQEQRFEIDAEGQTAYAHYALGEGRHMVFDHTYVPASLRGRGLAAAVVAAGLDYARGQGVKVVPVCSYVDAFIRRSPEYADLV